MTHTFWRVSLPPHRPAGPLPACNHTYLLTCSPAHPPMCPVTRLPGCPRPPANPTETTRLARPGRPGQARPTLTTPGWDRLNPDKPGKTRPSLARPGWAKPGHAWPGPCHSTMYLRCAVSPFMFRNHILSGKWLHDSVLTSSFFSCLLQARVPCDLRLQRTAHAFSQHLFLQNLPFRGRVPNHPPTQEPFTLGQAAKARK